jgi:predicted DNA-binding ribbon-helix-helix protein
VSEAGGPGVRKRSVTLAGHRTSLSLEPEFWDALKAAARAEGLSLNVLIETCRAPFGSTSCAGHKGFAPVPGRNES